MSYPLTRSVHVPNSNHWFTTSFFGGGCRKAMLGVCVQVCQYVSGVLRSLLPEQVLRLRSSCLLSGCSGRKHSIMTPPSLPCCDLSTTTLWAILCPPPPDLQSDIDISCEIIRYTYNAMSVALLTPGAKMGHW